MLKKLFLLTITSITLCSCSPRIKSNFTKRYPPLKKNDSVKVLTSDQYYSINGSKEEIIGTISVTDGGFTTNCNYNQMLQIIIDTAKNNGGNIIGIKKHLDPSFWGSTCHQFSADILKSNTNLVDSLGVPYASNKQSTYYMSSYEKQKLENRVIINFRPGIAFRIGKKDRSTEFLKSYSDILNTGATFSISSLYKLKKDHSLGLKYSFTHYGGEIDNVIIDFEDGRTTETGVFEVDQNTHFIALNSYSNHPIGNGKNSIIFDTSLGYVKYKEINSISTILTYSGGSLGYDINVGYHRNISKHFSLGINMGIFLASIRNLTVNDGVNSTQYSLDDTEAINLSNFNTGLHLNYSF